MEQAELTHREEELVEKRDLAIKVDKITNIKKDLLIHLGEHILQEYTDEYSEYEDSYCRASSCKKDETPRDACIRGLNHYGINIDANDNTIVLDSFWSTELSDCIDLKVKLT